MIDSVTFINGPYDGLVVLNPEKDKYQRYYYAPIKDDLFYHYEKVDGDKYLYRGEVQTVS